MTITRIVTIWGRSRDDRNAAAEAEIVAKGLLGEFPVSRVETDETVEIKFARVR